MKKILILLLLAGAGLAGYKKFFPETSAAGIRGFDLATVEERPIPRTVIFKLWKEVGLQRCSDARTEHNLTPEQCREIISERHADCERPLAATAPDTIGRRALAKSLGKQYLECVTPHFFCKGVEVRTEEEARRHCR